MNKNDIDARIAKRLESGFHVEADWGSPGEVKGEGGTGFLHVPARGHLEILCLSDVPASYKGHYLAGRMQPCMRVNCAACAKGVGQQSRWVFSVYDCNRGVTGLLELGCVPAGLLQQFSRDYGGLRGLRFKLLKAGGTLRGRIEIELSGLSKLPSGELPDPIDVPEALKKMWSEQSSKALLGT
jgi:hypothetical protein